MYRMEEQRVEVLGFRVSVINVVLFTSARLGVYLNCKIDDNYIIDYKEFVIEGEEYAGWNNDDTYIMKLVENKLALKI